MLDEKLVKECHSNYDLLNPVVAANIDFKTPEEGEVINKLCTLAKERNIDYTPSMQSQSILFAYCLKRNIPPPINVQPQAPQYAPVPMAFDANVD